METNMSHRRILSAIAAVARGELVLVTDDESRENEGDLIMAAEAATPERVAFMVRHTSGLLCVGARSARLQALELPLMVPNNTEAQQTAFTVSVDYRYGTSTGISAADRSATIRALANPSAVAEDFARPGHVFPLRARPGGVLVRPGHTEAAADFAELAGFSPLGVLAEVVNDDGSMARKDDLSRFALLHGLCIVSIAELIAFRRSTASTQATQQQELVHVQHSLPSREASAGNPRPRTAGMHSA
jgi:3,4-dihydroxy-2-butanone 4-phosphate synthase